MFVRNKAVKNKSNTNDFISCSVRLRRGGIQQLLCDKSDLHYKTPTDESLCIPAQPFFRLTLFLLHP